MPRPKNLHETARLHISLDAKLKTRIDLLLYSEVEQRIPYSSWGVFIEARLREWLEWKNTPLEPYGFPPGYFITGPEEMVQSVVERLKGTSHGTV